MTALLRFAELIEKVSGNVVPEGQYPFLERMLSEASGRAGFDDPEEYLRALAADRIAGEWRRLLPGITVKESFLFRVPEQFEALRQSFVPELVRSGRSGLAIWSAACARGEEPATLAVILADHPLLHEVPWTVVATDLDEDAIAVAREGRFGARAVARVPPRLLERWFEREERGVRLGEELRRRISYRSLNLFADPFPDLGGPFDVVFLRNVLIYFRPEAQRRVLQRVREQMRPDGVLFLGHSETLWKLSSDFEAIEMDGCFAYRLRREESGAAPAEERNPVVGAGRRTGRTGRTERAVRAPGRSRPEPAAPPPTAGTTDGGVSPQTPPEPPAAGSAAAPEPAVALPALVRLEDAVAALAANRTQPARELVDRYLQQAPEDAEGHALEGFLHDLGNRAPEAISAYRAALFLEPRFYQLRLLLAARLEEAGHRDRARAEYRAVLTALADPAPRQPERLAALPLPSREHARERARRALRRL